MQWFVILIIFIIGASFGSFLNAWMWRSALGKIVVIGRSVCPNCKKNILCRDNIPLLSFFFLKGKCRACGRQISWQYPMVELWMGMAYVLIYLFHLVGGWSDINVFVRDCFIVFFLTFIFIYDVRHQLIIDKTTIIPAACLFVFSVILGWRSWQSMGIGLIVGAGFFLIQYIVSKGRWIGGGDIRLGLFMGVILGWPLILLALFFAYILGAIVNIPILLMKKKMFTSKVAFGAYLSFATFVTMFWGERVLGWYIHFLI